MTRSTVRNGNRRYRWIERILLFAGIAGVGVWLGNRGFHRLAGMGEPGF